MNGTTRSRFTKGAIALIATAGIAVAGAAAASAAIAPSHTKESIAPHGRGFSSLIQGEATPGAVLTAATPSWLVDKGGIVSAIQWSVDGVAVAGGTGATFDVGGLAPGTVIGLSVTFAFPDGTTKEKDSRAVVHGAFAVAGAPVVTASGTEVGATLTVDPASAGWTPAPTSYFVVWFRDGAPIARGESYVTTGADADKAITAKVVAFADYYVPLSAVSAAVVVTAPPPPPPAEEPAVPADPGAPAPADPGVKPDDGEAWKHHVGECDDDRDGWADGDHDRDGRVDATGTWWGGPDGGDHGGDRGDRGDDRGNGGGGGGNDRGDRGDRDGGWGR